MYSRKGQQGVELLVIFATALAMFVVFYALFAQQYGDSMRRQAQADGVSAADSVAIELGIAARAGNGYQRMITYPRRIPGAETFTLEVNNVSGSVDLNMTLGPGNTYAYSSPVLTRNITGERVYASPRGFYLEISRGYALVENRQGSIVVTQMTVD